jgi:hypothetical protein
VAVTDFSLFLLTLFFLFIAVFVFYIRFFSCQYVQVCKLIYYSEDGPKIYDIDCDLIYSRAKNTTGAELTRVACSDEVLSILENMTNLTLKGKTCWYNCCYTDGNYCSGGKAVNIQAIEILGGD